MSGELTGKVEGSLKDLMPLAFSIWEWAKENVLLLMGFVVVLTIIAAWRRRGSK